MSDTKALNNRLDTVERRKFQLEEELTTMRQQRDTARSDADYFRKECRSLAAAGNAARGIEESLTRRLAALQRDAMPGDRIAAAAVIECRTVLDIVRSVIGGPNA